MTNQNLHTHDSHGFTNTPVGTVIAIVLAIGLVSAGIGTVALAAPATADAGAAYLGYKAYNDDLNSNNLFTGVSAILSGSSTAASGAATYISASGTAAIFGASAAATGGLAVL